MRHAWFAKSARDLTEQLGRNLADAGVPLLRLNVGIWTLHPQLAGTTYTWNRARDGVTTTDTPRGALQEQAYLKSPERFVSKGLGGVRQRLDRSWMSCEPPAPLTMWPCRCHSRMARSKP